MDFPTKPHKNPPPPLETYRKRVFALFAPSCGVNFPAHLAKTFLTPNAHRYFRSSLDVELSKHSLCQRAGYLTDLLNGE